MITVLFYFIVISINNICKKKNLYFNSHLISDLGVYVHFSHFYSFSKYLWSKYHVPDPVLSAGKVEVNKVGKIPAFQECIFY